MKRHLFVPVLVIALLMGGFAVLHPVSAAAPAETIVAMGSCPTGWNC